MVKAVRPSGDAGDPAHERSTRMNSVFGTNPASFEIILEESTHLDDNTPAIEKNVERKEGCW